LSAGTLAASDWECHHAPIDGDMSAEIIVRARTEDGRNVVKR
jgi:hypothetical protein